MSALVAIRILTWDIGYGGSVMTIRITVPTTVQVSTTATPVLWPIGAEQCPLDTRILSLVRATGSNFATQPDLLKHLRTSRRKDSEPETRQIANSLTLSADSLRPSKEQDYNDGQHSWTMVDFGGTVQSSLRLSKRLSHGTRG